MGKYKKNYAPKCRQEVAGANDDFWIPEMQKPQTREEKQRYDRNYKRIFGHD